MGRKRTVGVKWMSREDYNAYHRNIQRKKRARDRVKRGLPEKLDAAHKRCATCKIVFPKSTEYFYKMGKTSLGVDKLSSWCKSCQCKYVVKWRYKLKQTDYDRLTSGHCDICWKKKKLFIDHCHTTQKIRGALCRNCNAGIGMLCENPVILQRAIDYLHERS